MNSNHNKLNDYFREARNEIPVITEEEANTVISTGKFSPASEKCSPNNNLGGKIMYISAFTVAVITAGIITFNSFTGSNPVVENEKHAQYSEPAKSVIAQNDAVQVQGGQNPVKNAQVNKIEKIKIIKTDGPSDPVSKNDPPGNINSSIFSKLDVKGVHMIEMTPEQLQKLGLADYSSGMLRFYAFKDSPNPVSISLSIDKINTSFSQKIPETASGIYPRFVSDDKGNRRLSLISDDDIGQGYMETFVEHSDSSGLSSSRAMTMKIGDFNRLDDKSKSINKNLDYDITSKKWTDENVITEGPDSGKSVIKIEQTPLEGGGTNNMIQMDNELMKKYGLKVKINDDNELWKECVEGASDDIIIVARIVYKMILKNALSNKHLDVVLPPSLDYWENHPEILIGKFRDFVDSVAKSYVGKDINLDKRITVKEVIFTDQNQGNNNENPKVITYKVDCDSNFKVDEKVSKLPVDLLISSLLKDCKIDKRVNTKLLDSLKINPEGIMDAFQDITKNLDDYIRVNKLIPVAVSFEAGKINHILWFDPTKEFIDKLPAEIKSKLEPEVLAAGEKKEFCDAKPAIAGEDTYFDVWRSCSGAVEKLNLYPNPATGRINVGYNLTESRNVTITLHSLTGKYIRTLQQETYQPGGSLQLGFELEGIEPGLYLITIKTDKDEQAVQRLIIQ